MSTTTLYSVTLPFEHPGTTGSVFYPDIYTKAYIVFVFPFVCFGRLFVRSSVTFVKFTTDKGLVKVSGLNIHLHSSTRAVQI